MFSGIFIWLFHLLVISNQEYLAGELSNNQLIFSSQLNYSLQYRVYTPPGFTNAKRYPVLYVTDGQWFISEGKMVQTIDQLIRNDNIHPVILIFIDNRDPEKLTHIRREQQFLCNSDFLRFFTLELIPEIDRNYPTIKTASRRGIVGMSYGGLNAAYFGINAPDQFGMVAMLSPAFNPCQEIYQQYRDVEKQKLKIFLSTGTINDTEIGSRQMKNVLEEAGYKFKYIEVASGHNWNNWRPLIDDLALYLLQFQ